MSEEYQQTNPVDKENTQHSLSVGGSYAQRLVTPDHLR